jgi:predicted  nucleic acid-binding Zn-ribbon protein
MAKAEGEETERLKADLQAALTGRDELTTKVAELEAGLAGARAAILSRDEELEARVAAAVDSAAAEERIQAAELKAADAQERLLDLQVRLEESEAKQASAQSRLPELEAGLATLADLESRATRAQSALTESMSKLQTADAALSDAAAKLRAVEEARAEAELVRAAGTAVGDPSEADLQSRVEELESARRSDIVELQRAQESLANTQVELTNANRRLKEAEGRLRELESGGPAAAKTARPPVPVPDYVTREPKYVAADSEYVDQEPGYADQEPATAPERERDAEAPAAEVATFAARLASFGREIGAETSPPVEVPPEGEEQDEEHLPAEDRPPVEEEGLSLRERLARAAAARHRGPLS